MRSRSAARAAIAVLMLAGGCSSSKDSEPATAKTVTATATMPVVAPYLDVDLGSAGSVAAVAAATGQKNFMLAFLLASGGSCTPAWGGTKALTDTTVAAEIAEIGSLGGTAVVATGGATGTYLESVCSPGDLATAYEKALDAAKSNALDLDIENTVLAATIVQALLTVQKARGTAITLTLPTAGPAGLDSDGVTLLRSVREAGIDVTVNAMVMDFEAPGDRATVMTAAAEAVHAQLAGIWTGKNDSELYAMQGITPMIGVNDTGGTTTLADAKTILSYARNKGLGLVRFWSVNRDNGNCADAEVSSACSGIDQSKYAFTKLFVTFG